MAVFREMFEFVKIVVFAAAFLLGMVAMPELLFASLWYIAHLNDKPPNLSGSVGRIEVLPAPVNTSGRKVNR